jgi:hypothetical protein
MPKARFRGGKHTGLLAIGAVIVLLLLMNVFWGEQQLPETEPLSSKPVEAVRKEAYDLGYKNGYETAKEENKAAYQQGYEAAKDDIGSGAFTRSGILGFFLGLVISLGGFVAIKRQELTDTFQKFRKQYELRRTFKTIPANLSPEVDEVAQQIARAYSNIFEQLRSGKGYMVSQYMKQWRGKLQELMKNAVRLMELIQELETARENIDEKQLARTIRSLQRTIQNPNSNDDTRNAAVKSLQRAKQTKLDLLKTQKNLEHCRTSLKGITGVLESMNLKISNLKVNTQKAELLDELSSDLENEMSALEEVMNEFTL